MTGTLILKDVMRDLANVGSAGLEKTAGYNDAASSAKVDSAKKELMDALTNVESVKTASPAKAVNSAPAVDNLVKMATDLAKSENEATVKEAHLLGAAFADGAMARFNQYEQAAGSTKVASVKEIATTGDVEKDFEKFAAANPDITRQAIELGYFHKQAELEQAQKQAFARGRADASLQIQELVKTAEGQQELEKIASYMKGQTNAAAPTDFEKWASTPEGQASMPMVRKGYDDAVVEINKFASDTFTRGYNDTIAVLQSM